MGFIILYCAVCYILAVGANLKTKHMPWYMLIMAPASVPISLSFVYSDALNRCFGDS